MVINLNQIWIRIGKDAHTLRALRCSVVQLALNDSFTSCVNVYTSRHRVDVFYVVSTETSGAIEMLFSIQVVLMQAEVGLDTLNYTD